MTALEHATPASAASHGAAAAVPRVAGLFRGLLRALLHRREIDRLAELSDHQLADIGLLRSDLTIVRHAPLNTDPTTRLTSLARERYWAQDAAHRVC